MDGTGAAAVSSAESDNAAIDPPTNVYARIMRFS
jgi:hypothetical protein